MNSTTLSRLSNAGMIYDANTVEIWRVPDNFLGVQTITYGTNLFGDDSAAPQHMVAFVRQFESNGSDLTASDEYPDAYSQFDTDRTDLPYADEAYVEIKRGSVLSQPRK